MEGYRYFSVRLHGTLYNNRDVNCSMRLIITRVLMTSIEYCGTVY